MKIRNHIEDYFGYDLCWAMRHGNIIERLFHSYRVSLWSNLDNFSYKKVLDIGCNTGIITIPLALKGCDITGIDNNPKHIQIAKKYLIKAHLPPRIIFQADANKLPFKNNAFDAVFLSDILEHVSDPARIAREAVRVIKPGGLVYVTVPFGLHPIIRYSWMRKMLSSRKDVDEHPDIPFSFSKLLRMFPDAKLKKKKLVYLWSSIFAVFEKTGKYISKSGE